MDTNTTNYQNALENFSSQQIQNNHVDKPIEWFNISTLRLFLLSMITCGFYLLYWLYRQLNAINTAQKQPNKIEPYVNALFFLGVWILSYFYQHASIGFFLVSFMSFEKIEGHLPKRNKIGYRLNSFLFGAIFNSTLRSIILSAIIVFLPKIEDEMLALWMLTSLLYLILLVCTFIGTLIVIRYQKIIRACCKEANVPVSKFGLLEFIWILIGLYFVYDLFMI